MKCYLCGFENAEHASACAECGVQLSGFVRPSDVYRVVTAVSIEMAGYRKLFESMDHESAAALAAEFVDRIADTVRKFKGLVYRCESDYVICLYGIPVIHEDDPELALLMTGELLKSVPEANKSLAKKYGVEVKMALRIGIHKSRAIVKPRSPNTNDYAVIGDVIDNAISAKDFSSHDDILVTEPVFNATRYLYDYEALPPVSLAGRQELKRLFRPLRMKSRPESKHGIAGLYSPMVGRDDELSELSEVLSDLEEGKGGVAFILGDAGVGKSRLWSEAKKMIVQNQKAIQVYEVNCLSLGETLPDWTMIHLLRRVIGVTGSDPSQIAAEKTVKKMQEIMGDEWKKTAPYVGALLGVRFHGELDELTQHLSAHELRQQIMSTVRDLFMRMAQKKPLLVAIDDFHYIDDASMEILETILTRNRYDRDGEEAAPAVVYPILVIGIARVEKERAFWKAKEKLKDKQPYANREILLSPLTAVKSLQIVDNLLALNEIPDFFKNRIVSIAGGYPLFIEELIRSFIDSGVLRNDAGIWRLQPGSELIEIPSSIQLTVFSRLEHLGDERDLLEKAAAVGLVFQERILECMKGVDRLTLSVKLATLEDLEFISRVPHVAESEYRFRHPLIREAIYGSLTAGQLKSLHRRVGDCFETVHAEDLEGFYEVLAHQYYMAEEWEKSYHYSMKSARKSMKYNLNREALQFLNQALRSIRSVKDAPDAGQSNKAIDAIRDKVAILHLIGENDKAMTDLNKGLTIARRMRSKKHEADLFLQKSEIHGAVSAYDQMLAAAESALALYKEVGDAKGQSECYNNIGIVYNNLGSYEQALTYYRESLRLMQDLKDPRGIAISLNNIGYMNQQQGKYDEAYDHYNRAFSMMKEINNKKGMAIALDNLGTVLSAQGEYGKAIEFHDQSLMIKERIGDRWGESASVNNIGYVHFLLGHYDQAMSFHQRSLKIKEQINDNWGQAISLNNIGHVYVVFGDYIRSFDYYTASLKISERLGNRVGITASMIGIGQLFVMQERFTEARDYLMKAELLARETGNKEYRRRVAAALGNLMLLNLPPAEGGGPAEASLERAGEYQGQAQALAEELKSKADIARARLLKARICTTLHKNEASAIFQESIRSFELLQLPLEQGEACYHYGRMLIENGQEWEGGEQLEKARKIFRGINARSWLRKMGDA